MTQRRLGDKAFLVRDDGFITRTLVSSLSLSDTPDETGFGLMEHS